MNREVKLPKPRRLAHVGAASSKMFGRSLMYDRPDERWSNWLGPGQPQAMLPTPKHDEAARELHVEDEVSDGPRQWVNAAPQPWNQKAGDQAANRHWQAAEPQNRTTWQHNHPSNKEPLLPSRPMHCLMAYVAFIYHRQANQIRKRSCFWCAFFSQSMQTCNTRRLPPSTAALAALQFMTRPI